MDVGGIADDEIEASGQGGLCALDEAEEVFPIELYAAPCGDSEAVEVARGDLQRLLGELEGIGGLQLGQPRS